MKYKLFSLSVFAFGFVIIFIFLNLEVSNNDLNPIKFSGYENLQIIDTNIKFLDIFFNNLVVAFILSILGFLSGGLLTIVTLFWNGFLLGIILFLGYYGLEIHTFLYLIKHIPLELYAFLIFSEFGLKGFNLYKKILTNNETIDIQSTLNFKKLIAPIIILFIASIIETL